MMQEIYPNTLSLGLSAEALLLELEERFPLTNPNPEVSYERLMYRAGQRSIVEFIQQRITEL
jgi:hypothetical protein